MANKILTIAEASDSIGKSINKEARKKMYLVLRLANPAADKQVLKNTAYDLVEEAGKNLSKDDNG